MRRNQMRFNSEEAARDYWEGLNLYYGLNNAHATFQSWVEDNNVSWLDDNLQKFLDEWEAI